MFNPEQAVIDSIVIDDVDDLDTDEEIWQWFIDNVVLKMGLQVYPGMKHSLTRDYQNHTARIGVEIRLIQENYGKKIVN